MEKLIPTIVERLFPDGQTLTYRSTVNGKRCAEHWSRYEGETARGHHRFEFLLELDPTALGGGGPLIRLRSQLETDTALRPLSYISETRGSTLTVTFHSQGITAELPGNDVRELEGPAPAFIIEDNVMGLDALMLVAQQITDPLSQDTRISYFGINSLLSLELKLAPLAQKPGQSSGGWYASSLNEEYLLRPDGLLLQARFPQRGLHTVYQSPPLTWPVWVDEEPAPPDTLATYEAPEPRTFSLQDVVFEGPVVPIGGTLTVPAGPGPFPAVLLCSGSGTHDRHGLAGTLDIGTHEWMDFLAEAGFVGLRYDKRGAGTTERGSDYLERGMDSIIADAAAAWTFLNAHPAVLPTQTYLLGHSQGGLVSLALSTHGAAKPAGVILAASVGRSWRELDRDQTRDLAQHTDTPEAQVELQIEQLEEFFDLVESGVEWTSEHIPDLHLPAGRNVPWLRESMKYVPTEMLAKLRADVLICQGEKDFQVSLAKDALRLLETARSAQVPVTLKTYPTLDHLFKPIKGTSTMQSYYQGARRVDAGFLQDLASWLLERANAPS